MTFTMNCFIPLLTKKNIDVFFSSLLEEGVGVKALDRNDNIYSGQEENVGWLLAIALSIDNDHKFYKSNRLSMIAEMRNFIKNLCNNIGINHFGIIVTAAGRAGWCGSNIEFCKRFEDPTGSPYRDPGRAK